ncbi:MAG: NAD(P)/FAD-dependent oxidoreductase [Magnetococcus sp. YQC-5]
MDTSSAFDAIIIGSGLGGLIAGAHLSQAGRRVQLLERHDKFGGAATTFKRRDLQVEVSLCIMDGLDDMDFKTPIFKKLGMLDSLSMVTPDDFFNLRHPLLGSDFVMPFGYERAIDVCKCRFPHHLKAIQTYFSTIRNLRNARNNQLIHQLKSGTTPLSDLADCAWGGAETFWSDEKLTESIWRANKISMGRFLQVLFGNDEAVKFALCANLHFIASNLDHISLFDFALSQASYHFGAHYARGGSQKLSDHLVALIRNAGGEALCRREVTRIHVQQNRAVGVEHQKVSVIASGKPVTHSDPKNSYASIILGNATPGAIKNMLSEPERQAFFAPYEGIPATTSNWSIYLGFDRKPEYYGVEHYANFIYPEWLDSMKKIPESCTVMGLVPGSKIPPFMFCDYSRLGEMVSDNGISLGVMHWLDQLCNWDSFLDEETYQLHKKNWIGVMIQVLDQTFPGIKESIVFHEMATPRTVKAYLNDPLGSVHGFTDPELLKLGKKSSSGSRTGVQGLLLASSFAFGPGYSKAVLAGTLAAEMAFKELQRR